MSKDIRSFFKPIQKNGFSTSKPKPKVVISSDEEDCIAATPSPSKKNNKRKLSTKISKEKSPGKSPKKGKTSKTNNKASESLKAVDIKELLASTPVKQSKPKLDTLSEKNKKKDKKFEETLKQLDDDFDVDDDELNKTIEDALKQEKEIIETSERSTRSSPRKGSPVKTPTTSQTPKRKSKDEKFKKMLEELDETDTEKTPRAKKRKATEELNVSGMDPDQERHEKRRQTAVMYQRYLNRGEPPLKGQKELPKGKKDCLKGLCFLKTGILDSLDSESLNALVVEHGGRTVKSVSKKVDYLVVGEEPGPAKVEKAQSLGITEISEDDLLNMILEKSGKPPKYGEITTKQNSKTPTPKKEEKERKPTVKIEPKEEKVMKTPVKQKVKEEKRTPSKFPSRKTEKELKPSKEKTPESKTKVLKEEPTKKSTLKEEPTKKSTEINQQNKCLTEKYKPTSIKGIIGQQTTQSNMKKLYTWLKDWQTNYAKGLKAAKMQNIFVKKPDGANFRCALLSGPPGVGKTTTATLVAEELGFDIVEFNASDTRNKKLLHEEVAQLLSCKSISSFAKGGNAPTKKHVLLMDEVDGMSGNQDRGGIQELIALLKNSNVPIICMCNDRQNPKMRSLVGYCYDLRFSAPKTEQIRGAMMSVCFKEDIKISPDDLMQLIISTGNDVRQTLNHLSMWTASGKTPQGETANTETKTAKKDTVLGPWEVVRSVFSKELQKTMDFPAKVKLFFYDYSIGPLFVQENYLNVEPACPNNEKLERAALAADAISMADVIDAKIRSSNNWSLMESQAMFASVMPGFYMSGHFKSQINFPSWLGKNSRRNKLQRLVGELQMHMKKRSSASKQSVNLDYIYLMRDKLTKPLLKDGKEGIVEAVSVMTAYDLLREDLDSIVELSRWPEQPNPMDAIPPTAKAAFTRAYNKNSPALPYSVNTVSKKKAKAADNEEGFDLEEEEDDVATDEENDDVSKDAMIKVSKKTTKKEDDSGGSKVKKGKTIKPSASSSSIKGKAKKPK